MASAGQKKTRLERVAALELPPGHWERMWLHARRRSVLARVGLAVLASLVLCVVLRGWDPPFVYQTGYVATSDIVARGSFSPPDPVETAVARELAQSTVRFVYVQNPEALVQLRRLLRHTMAQITSVASLAEVNPQQWQSFRPEPGVGGKRWNEEDQQAAFARLRDELGSPEKLGEFDKALATAFSPVEQRGLLDKVARELGRGNYEEIVVYPIGQPEARQTVKIADVLIGDGKAVYQRLLDNLSSPEVAELAFVWLRPRLTRTLTLDEAETKRALAEAAAAAGEVLVKCEAGQTLVPAGQRIDKKHAQVLRLEHEAFRAQRELPERLARGAAVAALIFALFWMCGVYLRYRQSRILANRESFIVLLGSAVITVAVASWASVDAWQAEIVPMLLFGMTAAIASGQALALVATGVLAAVVGLGTGQGLGQFLILFGTAITAILQLGQLRSRAKLVYVGLVSGCVAMLLDGAVSLLGDQPLDEHLLIDAVRTGLWTLAAGFLMTGLLPFVESFFGVLTDLSLLELGDVAHPLLQELVRRAPATYNHSMTVGSIAEAAAESIGARGLLVRVGAYFHDIGKMLKPGYFVENQGSEGSRHDALLPAMSTLVIIAHVKDGADLGRQKHLPRPIIDLIEQHHGTTLVEYFFDLAHEQKEQDPNGGEVDESTFRYPGPKPQTKEAGVLMLADVVEGASRALVEPTPARLESLVHELAERRLEDGQFDETGLTLRELRTIQRSLIKSLAALYHGRIKYPEQKTA